MSYILSTNRDDGWKTVFSSIFVTPKKTCEHLKDKKSIAHTEGF